MNTNKRNLRIAEAREKFEKVLNGDLRARADVMETMTTSDFPILLGAAYGREVLSEYQGIDPVWNKFSRRVTVPDFRPKKLVELLGGKTGLSKVAEASEYKARSVSEAEYSFSVEKFGDRIPLTWEMLVNDDLDAFRDLPTRLATAARETEDIQTLVPLYNAAGGPNTAFFKTANKNAVDNKPLTSDNLQLALENISTRKDSDGRPIVVAGAILMVPPSLEIAARRILNASEIRTTVGDRTTIEANYLRDTVQLVVNPWMTVVDKGAKAAGTWFVLPAPSSARPAVATAFLRGNETPDLRTKADTGNRVGGGSITPEEGSFDDDTIQYRIRHVLGGTTVIPTATYASTGS